MQQEHAMQRQTSEEELYCKYFLANNETSWGDFHHLLKLEKSKIRNDFVIIDLNVKKPTSVCRLCLA
jgi:hypothetical protein